MEKGSKKLAERVDSYGRTADTEFNFGALLEFLEDDLGSVDEDEAFVLASTSSYLFEAWKNTERSVFMPRRRFFQGAEFRIVPTQQEIEGGFLFPGHRFMPFVSREVFPGDLWLVLPDGSAPHVKRISLPIRSVLDLLAFFGKEQAGEYLISEDPANAEVPDQVSVTAYDLRNFYSETGFKTGDALMVRVVDWLQGVYSLSHIPADPQELPDVRDWTRAMRAAYDRMQFELGSEGDCYEQFSIMLLLAQEAGTFPVMKNPPQSLLEFVESQYDVVVNPSAEGGTLCAPDAEMDGDDDMPAGAFGDDLEDLMSPLDLAFKELGLSCSEAEAEAYMRDALFHGLDDSDAVLGRLVAGRSLVFGSAEDQEEFHELWNTLWEDVDDVYMRDLDSHAKLRTDLLLLNDQRFAFIRGLDKQAIDSQKLAENPYFKDFVLLTASLSVLLGQLNLDEELWEFPTEDLDEIASVLLDRLPGILEELKRDGTT